jgi:hypothetical protein
MSLVGGDPGVPMSHNDQLADIFTKPLDQATFTHLRGEIGVCLIS